MRNKIKEYTPCPLLLQPSSQVFKLKLKRLVRASGCLAVIAESTGSSSQGASDYQLFTFH